MGQITCDMHFGFEKYIQNFM